MHPSHAVCLGPAEHLGRAGLRAGSCCCRSNGFAIFIWRITAGPISPARIPNWTGGKPRSSGRLGLACLWPAVLDRGTAADGGVWCWAGQTGDYLPEGARRPRMIREARWMAVHLCAGGAESALVAAADLALGGAGAAGPAVLAAVSSGRAWRLSVCRQYVREHPHHLYQPRGAVSGLEHALSCRTSRLSGGAVSPPARTCMTGCAIICR